MSETLGSTPVPKKKKKAKLGMMEAEIRED
jgi:hypothetical protein